MDDEKIKELKCFSVEIQMETMKAIASRGVGHVGGSLSIAEVLAVLYGGVMKYDPANPKWSERDWFVCSKGHAGPAVYATLALKGFFPMEMLYTLNQPGTNLPSHCDRLRTPGIDMTTGSLGQGASSAAGIALANKMDGKDSYTYLIMGDGEIEEGQVWEMALFAGAKKLDHLIAFVDYNKLQLDGPSEEIGNLGDVADKFRSFGWYAQNIDGHDVGAIYEAIENAKQQKDVPSVVVLNTVKAHGWPEMENKAGSHSTNVSQEQLESVLAIMQARLDEIKGVQG